MVQISAVKNSIQRVILESYQEMKLVVWPSRNDVVKHTIMVILFSLAVAAFLGGLDLLFSQGLQKLLSLKAQ